IARLKKEVKAEKSMSFVREAFLAKSASIFQGRLAQIAAELEEMGQVQKTFGDFRECEGAIGALRFMKNKGFNQDKELEMYFGFESSMPTRISDVSGCKEDSRKVGPDLGFPIQRMSCLELHMRRVRS